MSSRPKTLLVVIAIVLGIVAFSAAELKGGRWGFGLWRNDIPVDFRRRLLPWFAGGVILTVAAMINVSGGAVNSSFSHFLGIISSLSIVLAATWRTRLLITFVSVVAYMITSWFRPILDLRPLLGPGQITFLHDICFGTSVLLAILATYDRKKAKT